MTLNRYRLRHLASKGHPGAKRAQALLEKPDLLIALILLGNNFVNILIAQLATYIGFRLFGEVGIAIATGVLTLLLLIFAELAPKTLAALHSEKVAFPAALIYVPLLSITYPIVRLVNVIANWILHTLGVPAEFSETSALSTDELRVVVNETGNLIPKKNQKMLLNILDLEKVTVDDIMVPRSEIVGIDLDEDWGEIVEQLTSGIYTQMPVYRGEIDNVVGFLHIRNVMPLIMEEELTPGQLQKTVREAYFIPENTTLYQQLHNFQKGRRRFGLVVDEYGDIQGLVTLEDLLEEIVGEFTSDPATFEKDIQPQEDGSYVVDGSTHLRELQRILKWEVSSEKPRTINGLILEYLEQIPEPGTSILIDGHPVEIVQTKDNAVKTVRIRPRLKQHTAESEDM